MIHRHELAGCGPAPLGSYLKALGILRLVTEQVDPAARGAWRDQRFVLWTRLSREELLEFFLREYRPTPLVAPWGKGSGLMSATDLTITPIENSTAPRLAPLRAGIAAARAINAELGRADAAIRLVKEEAKRFKTKAEKDAVRDSEGYKVRVAAAEREFKRIKADVIPSCRRQWRGPELDWLEAAVVVTADSEAKFPALLGTGGNDGRLDMTYNVMQRISELFTVTTPDAQARLPAQLSISEALFGGAAADRQDVAVGQFLPGAAGGANSGHGPSGQATANPWDFVLALEGAVALRSAPVRRIGATDGSQASAPFAVGAVAAGYGSAGNADEGPRGEQWLPIWTSPATYGEVHGLFGEGRAQTGRAGARTAVEMARSATRLGVARGVAGFVRFGYIERNGQSNLAVNLGYFAVSDTPQSRLIDDLAPWAERLHRKANDKHATGRLQQVERRLANAIFGALQHPDEAFRWQGILLAAAEVEGLLLPGTSILAGPIPPLQTGWIDAANDGSAEFRLALALGTAGAGRGAGGRAIDPARNHMLPLEYGRLVTDGSGLTKTVRHSSRVVFMPASRPEDALIALVARRLLEAESGSGRAFTLCPAPGCGAQLGDIAALLAGRVDLARVVQLARAFAAVGQPHAKQLGSAGHAMPDDGWLAVRIAHLTDPRGTGLRIPADPAIARRLAAGDAAAAVEFAMRRLGGAGLRTKLRFATADPSAARLWAAALTFPLSPSSVRAAVARIFPGNLEVSHGH